jgi:putative transposase
MKRREGGEVPRANRYFLPGHIWHITHHCHKQDFLLKFEYDRRAWIRWLFEAKKRYGLSILNYMATSNHVHLLVKDGGRNEIAKSMQLVAGRVAQEFNQRKSAKGLSGRTAIMQRPLLPMPILPDV